VALLSFIESTAAVLFSIVSLSIIETTIADKPVEQQNLSKFAPINFKKRKRGGGLVFPLSFLEQILPDASKNEHR
jgi:hypothetical protein